MLNSLYKTLYACITHSPPQGHLDYFQFGAIVNKAAVNILVQVFVWTYIFISCEYLEVELLGHRVGDCLVL